MMMVERHFVSITDRFGERQVHYRRVGSGPAVLLLHQSPQSSAEYEPLMREWAADFTVIAPDHPGYGLSDPLNNERASLEDFGDAVAAFLDAIGVGWAAVYGFHTGAGMAVALASRHPDKVSCVYANGYVVLSDAERDFILSEYLPRFEPTYEGSHLSWVWTRNRDQLVYFPWFDRRLSSRIRYTIPSPEYLQQALLEFLRAGDNYRVAYRAAFYFKGDAPLVDLKVPAIITATSTDVLRDHLDKIHTTSDSVAVKHGGTLEENLAEAHDYCAMHKGAIVPEPEPTALRARGLTNRIVRYAYGAVRIRTNFSGQAVPLLLLHGAGRASQNILSLAESLAASREVILIDLPGHGESDSWPADVSFTAACMTAITAVFAELRIDAADAWGEWAGGNIVCEYALRNPASIRRIALTGVQFFAAAEAADLADNYAPHIEPVWHGGHLLEYWHRVRSESLFWPWYSQTVDNIIDAEPRLDEHDLHDRVVARLLSGPDQARVHSEMFTFPLVDRLRDISTPVLLSAAAWDPNRAHTVAAAEQFPNHKFAELGDDPAGWSSTLLDFFRGD
jgi:pimeloyl-ACP methyl ester carboxylesterase